MKKPTKLPKHLQGKFMSMIILAKRKYGNDPIRIHEWTGYRQDLIKKALKRLEKHEAV